MLTIKVTSNICTLVWGSVVFDERCYVDCIYLLIICVNGIELVSISSKMKYYSVYAVCRLFSTLRTSLVVYKLALIATRSIHLTWTNVHLLFIAFVRDGDKTLRTKNLFCELFKRHLLRTHSCDYLH